MGSRGFGCLLVVVFVFWFGFGFVGVDFVGFEVCYFFGWFCGFDEVGV